MKNVFKSFGIIVLTAVMVFAMAACQGPVGPTGPAGPTGPEGQTGPEGIQGPSAYGGPADAVEITDNAWVDGNISADGEQWFKFTAADDYFQLIFKSTDITSAYAVVYNNNGVQVDWSSLDNNSYFSTSVTKNFVYYIRVGGASGAYQIALNRALNYPPAAPTALTANTLTDGNIETTGGEQWFSFTATADTQFVHFTSGTLTYANVQLCDSNGVVVGSQAYISSTSYIARKVTTGQQYYIKVTPNSGSGAYKIAFSASFITPLGTTPTALTVNTLTDGNIAAGGVQWYSFTATANNQFIHFSPGTSDGVNLANAYVQVYNSDGSTNGTNSYFTSTAYISRQVIIGQTYYIKVTPYNTSYSGAYKIAFNATITPPDVPIATLTANTFADGTIAEEGGVQWFTFTATSVDTQYIYFSPDALTNAYVTVYNSAGTAVGTNNSAMSSSANSISRTVTIGQTYYIRVIQNIGTGAYKIAFGSVIPPGVTTTAITANTFTDGSITTDQPVKEQWFSFTATAATQYIHFDRTGTLNDVYAYLYNSNGTMIGERYNLYGTFLVTSKPAIIGQTYYIKIVPYSTGGTGTYKIAISESFILPFGATPTAITAANTWQDGNIEAAGGVQWFTFTATAATQYIHFSPGAGALTNAQVTVYNSTGTAVGTVNSAMSSTTPYISRAVTIGQTYYIRVTQYTGTGAYKIGFAATTTAPTTP